MKVNTKKSRKPTHKFINDSRVTKVVVMPKYHTRAYADRFKYGLPAIFEVEPFRKESEYLKSLATASHLAQLKGMEINEIISKELFKGAPTGFVRQPYHGTYILEKINRSSKRIGLI